MTKKLTQSEVLVSYAEQAADMFHTPDDKAYVTVAIDGRVETWPANGRQFVRFLRWRFYRERGGAPSEQALAEARATVTAKAVFDGRRSEVFVRVAKYGEDTIYLDLGNERREVVEITACGWRVLPGAAVPVRFVRKDNAAELPRPMAGGSIEGLRRFVNVRTDEDFVLIVSWLVGALNPDGPYPILIVQGEQGSAKSTMVRVLRSLIDPAVEPLRAPPRDERDLAIAASSGWTLALDNLSGVKRWLSDALCRVATGGGIATRELYSDDRETVFRVKRPIVLNGIDSMSNAGDLRDRSVIVELPPIPPERKRTEREFYRELEAIRPRVLGALLDSASAALRNLNKVKLEEFPRVADFAAWVTAAEETLPCRPGTFITAYTSNLAEANALSVDTDPLAASVQELMLGRDAVAEALSPDPGEDAIDLAGALSRPGLVLFDIPAAKIGGCRASSWDCGPCNGSSSRPWTAPGRAPLAAYFDEVHALLGGSDTRAANSFAGWLPQVGKHGVAVHLAYQGFAMLPLELRRVVGNNASTKLVSGRLSAEDARAAQELLGTVEEVEEVRRTRSSPFSGPGQAVVTTKKVEKWRYSVEQVRRLGRGGWFFVGVEDGNLKDPVVIRVPKPGKGPLERLRDRLLRGRTRRGR